MLCLLTIYSWTDTPDVRLTPKEVGEAVFFHIMLRGERADGMVHLVATSFWKIHKISIFHIVFCRAELDEMDEAIRQVYASHGLHFMLLDIIPNPLAMHEKDSCLPQ
jgi:hypothetical protein